MKPFIKQLIVMFLLNSAQIGLTQTVSITNVDFHTTNDVVKIESHFYKEIPYKDIANGELNDILYLNFKNGLIESKIRKIISSNISHHTKFIHTKPLKEFTINYYRLNNEVKDYPSSVEHQLIVFNNNKFYIPKKEFRIIKEIPNKVLEITYKNYDNITNRKLVLNSDLSITDTYYDYGSIKNVYNQQGEKIESGFIDINRDLFSYYPDGLLKIQKTIFYSIPDAPVLNFFYYSKDKKGNWVQKLEIKKAVYGEKITYSTRKITYKNGETTGSKDYNITFINDKYKQYQTDVNNTVIMKDEYGCVKGDCEDGKGIFKYSNGDIYEGTYRGGLKDGKGTYTIPDGTTYTGEYLYGQMYGKGILTTPSGDTYSGNYIDGKLDGKIIYFNSEKNENYIQIYKNGTLISSTKKNNISKTGCVSGDCKNGYGKVIFKDGTVYEGTFLNGLCHGKGKITWANGDSYKGDWVENYRHGQGIYTYNNGFVYTGNFNNGKMTGRGTLTGNGNSYTGEFIDANFNGLGTYLYKNGNKTIAYWKDSKLDGEATSFNYITGKKSIDIYKEGNLIRNISTSNISINNKTNTLTETKATGFQAEINNCKQQANPEVCISNKLFENYTNLKKSGLTKEKVIQTTVENLNSIGTYNVEILFEILMDTDKFSREDIKSIAKKLDPNLKAKVKKLAQKVVDDYSKSYKN